MILVFSLVFCCAGFLGEQWVMQEIVFDYYNKWNWSFNETVTGMAIIINPMLFFQ